jgi:hypothetical protein
MQISPKGLEWMSPRSRRPALHRVRSSKSLGVLSTVEERPAELEIMLMDDESPYDGDVMVKPAVFLNLGPVPLNELSVVMDVRLVREQKVCCALVQHKPKEGSLWWTICGGTGAHSHQGLAFCGAVTSSTMHRTQATTHRQSSSLYDGYCCVQ